MLLLLSYNPRISALHCPSARPRHFKAKVLVVHPPAAYVARRDGRKMQLAPGQSPERAEDSEETLGCCLAVDDASPQSPRERFGHALSFISDNLINQWPTTNSMAFAQHI